MQPSSSPTTAGSSSVDMKRATSAGLSASQISNRGHQESPLAPSVSGSKDWSNLSVFSSFLNNSIFPIEDLHNVAVALKPPEKSNVPSSSQKGPTIFTKYQKKILIKFKGKTTMDIPYYPYVSDDADNESTTSKSPGPNAKKKPSSSTSGKRPGSSTSIKKGMNSSAISTEGSAIDEISNQKLWEHRVVYFVASNHGGNTGLVELHQTLIESQNFNIEKEHTIYMETLQDLIYFESCPFFSFVIRREFDPTTPPTTVEKKKSSKKESSSSNTGAKKDNIPPAPGLPATNTAKKVQTYISSATHIPLEELHESMIADIKATFGVQCEILHTFRASTLPLFVNDKFGYTKCKFDWVASPKYKHWSSLLDSKRENTSTIFDESFKSEVLSSTRFSLNALSFSPSQDVSEFIHNINVRFEVADGSSILSDEVQNKLNPMMVSISSLKDLPNESYLTDRCKQVSVSYFIRGKSFKTRGYQHDSLINLGYQRIIYLGNSNEMEMYRDYFTRMPIVFETHDRDPKEGIAKFYGRSEVALKTLILNSRGRDISENFQIQGYTILPDEYEKALKKSDEERRKTQAQEEEKKIKPNTKSPKNAKTAAIESPKNSINDSVFPVEYTIFEGKYVEKKSSIKIQLRFNTPFPQFTETEKSTYPIVLTFAWENSILTQKIEQMFSQYFVKPMVTSRSRADLFGGQPGLSGMNGGSISPVPQSPLTLSPETATSDTATTPGGGRSSGKDILKHFCGFEICDGKKRLLVIEATSKEAFKFFTMQLQNYLSKENLPVNVLSDPAYFYSSRLFEQLVLGPKPEKTEEKKPSGRRSSVQIESDQKKPIVRLRLQDTFENILSTKDMYIKNKKSDDIKILSALSKLNQIFSVDSINQIIEHGLLPDSSLLMSIKEKHCDDGLIEIDSIITSNQHKRKEEEQMHSKKKNDMAHTELYNSPQSVDDMSLHLGEEIGFEGIPLIETPQHLPPPEKVIFEGEEKRKKNRVKNWKTNPSGFSIDEVSAPEKKYWLYIPHLKGHIIASFPPMVKELPPCNLHSYMTGVLVRSDRKHPPPKIRAYTAFGSPGTRNRKPEITISPDIIYCILVSSWTQRASTQIDNQLDSKIRQSLLRKTLSPQGRNFIRGNVSTVKELSQQSSMVKQHEEMERSTKKFITVPTYPDQRKQTEKSIEFRNTAPPSNKPTWVKRGKSSAAEDNRHPKKPDQARIDELNMIDLFDRTMESQRDVRSTLFSPRSTTQEAVQPQPHQQQQQPLLKLPKLK